MTNKVQHWKAININGKNNSINIKSPLNLQVNHNPTKSTHLDELIPVNQIR